MNTVIPSEEQVIEWITSLSNWGRWGGEDQVGCLNLITPEKRKQAAALIHDGTTVSRGPAEKGTDLSRRIVSADVGLFSSQTGAFRWRYIVITSFFHTAYRGLCSGSFHRILGRLFSLASGASPMSLMRHLQHWLHGPGTPLHVTDFVPQTDPIRQWADTFPWAALVSATEQSFDTRFLKTSPRGRRPVPIRILLALELLKHELGASDEDICHRFRTDFAVMYACGLREYQINPSQAHFVLPETLCEFRGRIDEALMDELLAIQAAAAMEEGLVSPAHLVIDTFPCEQGSQRVTDATTLYKAQKKA